MTPVLPPSGRPSRSQRPRLHSKRAMSRVTIRREHPQIDLRPFAVHNLPDEFAGDATQADADHRVTGGDHEIVNGECPSQVRQAVGRDGPKSAPWRDAGEI